MSAAAVALAKVVVEALGASDDLWCARRRIGTAVRRSQLPQVVERGPVGTEVGVGLDHRHPLPDTEQHLVLLLVELIGFDQLGEGEPHVTHIAPEPLERHAVGGHRNRGRARRGRGAITASGTTGDQDAEADDRHNGNATCDLHQKVLPIWQKLLLDDLSVQLWTIAPYEMNVNAKQA